MNWWFIGAKAPNKAGVFRWSGESCVAETWGRLKVGRREDDGLRQVSFAYNDESLTIPEDLKDCRYDEEEDILYMIFNDRTVEMKRIRRDGLKILRPQDFFRAINGLYIKDETVYKLDDDGNVHYYSTCTYLQLNKDGTYLKDSRSDEGNEITMTYPDGTADYWGNIIIGDRTKEFYLENDEPLNDDILKYAYTFGKDNWGKFIVERNVYSNSEKTYHTYSNPWKITIPEQSELNPAQNDFSGDMGFPDLYLFVKRSFNE